MLNNKNTNGSAGPSADATGATQSDAAVSAIGLPPLSYPLQPQTAAGRGAEFPALLAPERSSSFGAGYSISPGSGSNLSNEAAAGHTSSPPPPTHPVPAYLFNHPQMTGTTMQQPQSQSQSQSQPQPQPQPQPLPMQSSSSSSSSPHPLPGSPGTRIVGGFDAGPGAAADGPLPSVPGPGSAASTSVDHTASGGSGAHSSSHGYASGPLATQMGGLAIAGTPTRPTASSNSTSESVVNGFSSAPQHLPQQTQPGHFQNSASVSTFAPPVSAAGTGTGALDEIIPTAFDESTLRALCDMDCGMPLLYDRIKQSMISANHAATFFKKRAAIEDEYGRSMIKLSRGTAEAYAATEAKAGTFVNTWQTFMKTHETIGENRIRFGQKLAEISDELVNLAKEVDKNRKYARDTGMRLEKNLTDAELSVEKSRSRFDAAAEDLERLLLLKSGESARGGELHGLSQSNGPPGKRTLGKAIGKSSLLFKNKNPQQVLRQEEDIRSRTANASDAFRKEVQSTQTIRSDYFRLQLPRILRSLKESAEEIDNGVQYHLSRYAFLYESTVLGDGTSISPVSTVDGSTGLKSSVEAIDNRADFKQFMQNYQVLHGREYKGPRREGPYEEGYAQQPTGGSAMSPLGSKGGATAGAQTRPIFGVPLAEQMERDGVDVPPILEKCAEAIEQVGIENKGIYRLSGTTSKVQRLKGQFDADWMAVDLMNNDEAIGDINIVAGCLKLWFRELPEPLMTWDLYGSFIEAAKIENDRLRHIRMHERVNDLPDANYATLKYLMGHLNKIRSLESVNQMSASNIAIVFGPTLLTPPPNATGDDGVGAGGAGAAAGMGSSNHLQDMQFQCKAVETILDRYEAIFVDEE